MNLPAGIPFSSSAVIAKALGHSPRGTPAKEEGVCALCGLHINVGDLNAPLAVSSGFMDDLSLAARGSKVTCGFCPEFMTTDGLRGSGYGVWSEADGFAPFRKWVDVAAALLNPPTPPFVMVYATANNQHMAWRAQVNFSREQFMVRVGLRDLRVRRRLLMEAVHHCERLGRALYGGPKAGSKRKTLPNPFIELAPDIKSAQHGLVHPGAFALGDLKDSLAATLQLTLGETWALRFVLTPHAGSETASA